MRHLFTILTFFLGLASTYAQLDITLSNTDYSINFDGTQAGIGNGAFTGNGFAPTPSTGRLDSDAFSITDPDLAYGGTETSGDFALGQSTGGVSQGGCYAFSGGSISGRALGVQQGGGTTPWMVTSGGIELKIINNTGQWLTAIDLEYTLHVKNDQPRGSEVSTFFRYEDVINGSTSNYDIPFGGMTYTSPAAGVSGTPFVAVPMSEVLTGIYVEPGDEFYIYWQFADAVGVGGRDEFAIDDITLNVSGVNQLDFYSQNTGNQTSTSLSATVLWSTAPTGGAAYSMYPFLSTANYTIQTGHEVTWFTQGVSATFNDLTIETGAQLLSDKTVTNGVVPRYLSLHGDLMCDGLIGNANGFKSALGINFEPGDHLLSGNGTIYCYRMRKSNQNLLNGICNMEIDLDIFLLYESGNCLYNNRQASASGTNQMHITINAGATVNAQGNIGLDYTNPASNSIEAGGSITVAGTLYVEDVLFLTTTNSTINCSLTVVDGGHVQCGRTDSKASGAAGHDLTVMDGGNFELIGGVTGQLTWNNFSQLNNTYDLQPGSTVTYSRSGAQNLQSELIYRNLTLRGAGQKIRFGVGDIIIMEDLNIQQSARINSIPEDIEIHGDWNNSTEFGFVEGTSKVTFINDGAPGGTSINCGGTEIFYDIEIAQGTVDMTTDLDVINTLSLDARLELNSNELLIRIPGPGLSILTPVGDEIIVSEDILHQGRITYFINGYTLPVRFPFGTSAGVPVYSSFRLNSSTAGTVSMATYGTGSNNLPLPITPTLVTNINSSTGLNPDNQNATADRYYNLTTSVSGVDADLELGFSDGEAPLAPFNDISLLRAQWYDVIDNEWRLPIAGQVVLQNTPTAQSNFVSIPNVLQFGEFALASEDSPLPVELLSFTGKVEKENIRLDWTTASEKDNAGFEVWKSSTGNDFKKIADVFGSGNSSAEITYLSYDKHPTEGVNYYFLRQIDLDGQSEDSDIIAVHWTSKSTLDLQLWRENEQTLRYEVSSEIEPHILRVFDMTGHPVHEERISQKSGRLSLAGLAKGTYILRIQAHGVLLQERFIH